MRSEPGTGGIVDGFLAVGKDLFTTTAEKERPGAEVGEEGPGGAASQQLSRILSREELIAHYISQGDVDGSYHYASARHRCAVDDGQSPMLCAENVTWIVTSPASLVGEFFSVYSLIMVAWHQVLDVIRGELDETDPDEMYIANEADLRRHFVRFLEQHNRFGYEIKWGLERSARSDSPMQTPATRPN